MRAQIFLIVYIFDNTASTSYCGVLHVIIHVFDPQSPLGHQNESTHAANVFTG